MSDATFATVTTLVAVAFLDGNEVEAIDASGARWVRDAGGRWNATAPMGSHAPVHVVHRKVRPVREEALGGYVTLGLAPTLRYRDEVAPLDIVPPINGLKVAASGYRFAFVLSESGALYRAR